MDEEEAEQSSAVCGYYNEDLTHKVGLSFRAAASSTDTYRSTLVLALM